MNVLDDASCRLLDERIESWRQGDCVVGEQWFVFRTALAHPLTEGGAAAASESTENAEVEVRGFAVLTQTCDLVRRCRDRPFVEVSPLFEVDESVLRETERGRRPNYAFIPGVADRNLVADLDRVMTIEKSVLADWARLAGCTTDDDTRRFSLALARKRARTAFPDDFVRFATPLTKRMSSKHDKDSGEGRALRALREIRVRAAPSWYAEKVELMFWFIRMEDHQVFEGQRWDQYLGEWLRRVPVAGRFISADGAVQTLDDLTAREYAESDPLDLDHLSTRES